MPLGNSTEFCFKDNVMLCNSISSYFLWDNFDSLQVPHRIPSTDSMANTTDTIPAMNGPADKPMSSPTERSLSSVIDSVGLARLSRMTIIIQI